MRFAISPEQKKEHYYFIKSNFNILSGREIAKRLNLGKTTVNRWSKELGLQYKKDTVNEQFFNQFNEFSSYILGFIYADGNVAWDPKKGYYSLTITASEKDKGHLERVRSLLQSTKPLLYSSQTKSYRLVVNNKRICKKLMKLGVIPRKSLIITFPQFIPRAQLAHFIRGIIDGDGNVRYVDRGKSPYFEITISSGSKSLCKGLIQAVKNRISVTANTRKVGKNTYLIQYSCSRGEKIAKFIYQNAHIFLERKYLAYKKCLEVKNGN